MRCGCYRAAQRRAWSRLGQGLVEEKPGAHGRCSSICTHSTWGAQLCPHGARWGSTAAWAPCRARREAAGLQLHCSQVRKETWGVPASAGADPVGNALCQGAAPLLPGSGTVPEGRDSAAVSECWILHIPAGPQPIRSCPSLLGARWLPWLNFGIKPCALTSHPPVPQGPQQAAEGVLAPGSIPPPQLAFGCLYFRRL